MQKDQLPGVFGLTLIPSNRDRALRGLKALSVLSDLIGPRSEKPNALAIRLTIDTYTDRDRRRGKTEAKEERTHTVRGDLERRMNPIYEYIYIYKVSGLLSGYRNTYTCILIHMKFPLC